MSLANWAENLFVASDCKVSSPAERELASGVQTTSRRPVQGEAPRGLPG